MKYVPDWGIACSTGHASGRAKVAQNLHRPPPPIVSTQSLCHPAECAAFWGRDHKTFPHSPGFWHCAHKHDSQDKRQAKRFCKPFMKHNEVFMEHNTTKGKDSWVTLVHWGEMKRSSSCHFEELFIPQWHILYRWENKLSDVCVTGANSCLLKCYGYL